MTLLRECSGVDLLYGLISNFSEDNHQGPAYLPSAKTNHLVTYNFLKFTKNQHHSHLFHKELLTKLEHVYNKTALSDTAYSELFWSLFSCNWTEYAEIRSISPYSVRMRRSTDQKTSEYEHF